MVDEERKDGFGGFLWFEMKTDGIMTGTRLEIERLRF